MSWKILECLTRKIHGVQKRYEIMTDGTTLFMTNPITSDHKQWAMGESSKQEHEGGSQCLVGDSMHRETDDSVPKK